MIVAMLASASVGCSQAASDIRPRCGKLVTNVGVLNCEPENKDNQKNDQGIFNQALAVLFYNQPFKKLHILTPFLKKFCLTHEPGNQSRLQLVGTD
jgi:hypothetical protein